MAEEKQSGRNGEAIQPPLPPYIPFKTLINFINKLHDTVVPEQVDSTLLRSYPGSVARQLKAALRYMGLIDEGSNTTTRLTDLVAHYGSPQWKQTLGNVMGEVYIEVVDGVNLDTATLGALQAAFRRAGADGQMMQKCITFYLSGLREAGMTFSPHFTEKAPRKTSGVKKPVLKGAKPNVEDEGDEDDDINATSVRFSFPVPDKGKAVINVPADLTEDDWDMISTMMRAYVTRRNKRIS